MRPRSTRLIVALDAASVTGAEVFRGFGRPEVKAFSAAPLAPGALVPSPFERNASRPEEVKAALKAVTEELGARGRRASVVLPSGVARIVLFDAPPNADALEYARFRLARQLPYAGSEAIVDVLPLGRGKIVAAAVHRAVVEEYEALAASAGLIQEELDLAPLKALAGLARSDPGPRTVDVILGDAAYCLAAHDGGSVKVVRQRHRAIDAAEWERLRDEAYRTASLAAPGQALRLRIVGSGGLGLLARLRASGESAEPGWPVPVEAEPRVADAAWLGEALA